MLGDSYKRSIFIMDSIQIIHLIFYLHNLEKGLSFIHILQSEIWGIYGECVFFHRS